MELLEEEVLSLPKLNLKYSVENEISYIKKLFGIQSPSYYEHNLRNHLIKIARAIENTIVEVDKAGNILITKGVILNGEYFPCIVAHMDMVFSFKKDFRIKYQKLKNGDTVLYATTNDKIKSNFSFVNKITSYGNTGLGADDKAGIWLAIKLLSEIDNIKVVFTVEEEVGGGGANAIDISFFDNVGYIIEGDRRGNCDLITDISDDTCSKEFKEVILPICKDYGYKETIGMFTDIDALLSRNIDISCINMSVGYYNPHTSGEYLVLEEMFKATQLAKDMIVALGNNKYHHEYNKWNGYNSRNFWNEKNYGFSKSKFYYDDDYFSDFEDEGYGYRSKVEKCTCLDINTIDTNCEVCNPVVHRLSGRMCECGEELVEKRYTLNCDYCNRTYILF